MRKLLSGAMIAAAFFLALSFTAAQAKADSWTGWISDSGCGAKGTNAGHKQCAMACVKEKGAKWVLVKSDTKDVIPIHNQEAVKESDLGQEVTVTGHLMDDKSLHVENIAPAAKSSGGY